ncbi:Menaquinone reductase, integral membrane subunit [Thermoflexales bacterium]|nr:Menaquinone reductase, integral membrane subunit [Thermoflexales bacterium]
MTLKRVLYVLCILALLFGAWGVFDRLTTGHENAAYGSYVVWGLWVAMYLFFAGVAAGCFMFATLDLLFDLKLFKGTGKAALWTGLVSLAAALLSIWLDLGHMERIWKVYLQPNLGSVMAQMVWGYTLFGLLLLVSLFLAIRKPTSKILKVLMIVGVPLSLFVSGAVGALLGVNAGRLFWHVGLLPVQFPIFSLASGFAAMLVVIGWFGAKDDARRPQQLWVIALVTIGLQVAKLYFLWADFSQSVYGNVPHNVEAVNQVLYGPYWWAFWIVQIFLGSIIPIVVLSRRKWAENPKIASAIGVLVLIGFVVARANIVFPALTVPELDALTTAFSGPHLSFDYFPSLMEWAVTIGIVGLAVLAFMIGTDRLKLTRAEVA